MGDLEQYGDCVWTKFIHFRKNGMVIVKMVYCYQKTNDCKKKVWKKLRN